MNLHFPLLYGCVLPLIRHVSSWFILVWDFVEWIPIRKNMPKVSKSIEWRIEWYRLNHRIIRHYVSNSFLLLRFFYLFQTVYVSWSADNFPKVSQEYFLLYVAMMPLEIEVELEWQNQTNQVVMSAWYSASVVDEGRSFKLSRWCDSLGDSQTGITFTALVTTFLFVVNWSWALQNLISSASLGLHLMLSLVLRGRKADEDNVGQRCCGGCVFVLDWRTSVLFSCNGPEPCWFLTLCLQRFLVWEGRKLLTNCEWDPCRIKWSVNDFARNRLEFFESWELTYPRKIGRNPREFSSSNHPFSGAIR